MSSSTNWELHQKMAHLILRIDVGPHGGGGGGGSELMMGQGGGVKNRKLGLK